MGGSLTKIVTFETKHFIRYSRHVRYLRCPLLGGFTVFSFELKKIFFFFALKTVLEELTFLISDAYISLVWLKFYSFMLKKRRFRDQIKQIWWILIGP